MGAFRSTFKPQYSTVLVDRAHTAPASVKTSSHEPVPAPKRERAARKPAVKVNPGAISVAKAGAISVPKRQHRATGRKLGRPRGRVPGSVRDFAERRRAAGIQVSAKAGKSVGL